MDYDPVVVDQMLDFMYTGSYDSDEAGSNGALVYEVLKSVKASEGLIRSKPNVSSTVTSLIIHLEMNSIADFYDVYQLRETALERITSILGDSWEEVIPWYPAFLEAAFKETTDTNLHYLLVNFSMIHYSELNGLVFGRGVNLDVPISFYSSLLGDLQSMSSFEPACRPQ